MTLASEVLSENQSLLSEMTVYQIANLISDKIKRTEQEKFPVVSESQLKTTLLNYGKKL